MFLIRDGISVKKLPAKVADKVWNLQAKRKNTGHDLFLNSLSDIESIFGTSMSLMPFLYT